jgi:hypothetical protein
VDDFDAVENNGQESCELQEVTAEEDPLDDGSQSQRDSIVAAPNSKITGDLNTILETIQAEGIDGIRSQRQANENSEDDVNRSSTLVGADRKEDDAAQQHPSCGETIQQPSKDQISCSRKAIEYTDSCVGEEHSVEITLTTVSAASDDDCGSDLASEFNDFQSRQQISTENTSIADLPEVSYGMETDVNKNKTEASNCQSTPQKEDIDTETEEQEIYDLTTVFESGRQFTPSAEPSQEAPSQIDSDGIDLTMLSQLPPSLRSEARLALAVREDRPRRHHRRNTTNSRLFQWLSNSTTANANIKQTTLLLPKACIPAAKKQKRNIQDFFQGS